MRVLIVEDDRLLGPLLANALRSRFPSSEVALAETLAGARRELSLAPPALAFVDVQLPDGSGLSLLDEIKAQAPDARVIVWTFAALPEYEAAAKQRGATRVLTKCETSFTELLALAQEVAGRQKE
jgi:two-component system NtrC family response regulator